jgi:uncharacterized Zn finger protein (UPF0148 family)
MSINSKVKKKKRRPSDNRVTLVAQHKSKIEELDDLKNNLPKLQKKLDKLIKERDSLSSSNNGFGFIESDKGKRIYFLNNEIKKLEDKLKKIENNKLKDEYYAKTSHIIYKYYDNVKDVAGRHKEDVFESLRKNRNIEKSRRANLLDNYTKAVSPKRYKPKRAHKKIEIDYCKRCEVEMNLIQSEGFVVCPQCGREEHILIDSDKPSYKDPPPEAGEFTYKRINRFDEWLTQYQAKETTEIPQEVLDSILLEMKKEGITNLYKLNMQKVRKYLKKLGLNKYYEHVPHIIYCLNGLPTPRLTPEIEEKLRSMFRQIQDIFDVVCPDNRTNFLSYSYLLRKLLELLGEDEHSKYFRLHKSRDKIYQHDKVWQKICKILGWQYIRTV